MSLLIRWRETKRLVLDGYMRGLAWVRASCGSTITMIKVTKINKSIAPKLVQPSESLALLNLASV